MSATQGGSDGETGKMDEWWRGDGRYMEGDSQLLSYYRLHEDCEWVVWRAPMHREGRRKILESNAESNWGSSRVSLSLLYAIVGDAIIGEVSE